MRANLENLFDERFQGKRSFSHFIACNPEEHIKVNVTKRRRSFVADEELRAYHSFILPVVVENLPVNSRVVFSYRKNASALDAVKLHSKSKFFYKTDIYQFFSSVDRRTVDATIRGGMASMPYSEPEKYVDQIVRLVTFGSFLPAGFATSPGISNACLHEFDEYIYKYCRGNGLVYSRYSDDIILSGHVADDVHTASSLIDRALSDIYEGRFKLNVYKSKFLHSGTKVKLLGLTILPNGHVTIDKSARHKVEVLLHFYVSDGMRFLTLVNNDLESGRRQIKGYLNYFRSVDPNYIGKLKRKYGDLIVESFLDGPGGF